MNGDGLDDLIIGAYGADPDGKSGAGKSYVVFGKRKITAQLNYLKLPVVMAALSSMVKQKATTAVIR